AQRFRGCRLQAAATEALIFPIKLRRGHHRLISSELGGGRLDQGICLDARCARRVLLGTSLALAISSLDGDSCQGATTRAERAPWSTIARLPGGAIRCSGRSSSG